MLTPVKALHPPFLCCNFAVMKRLFSIIIGVCLLVGLTACQHHHPYNNQLARIDSLADVNPDSADILLRAIPDSALMKGEEYFERVKLLLRIKTDDKLYRPVTHYRDTILQLVECFEHHRRVLPSLLGSTGPALPYLYAGRIFADLGDAPQALDYYQRALDAIPIAGIANGEYKADNATDRRLAKQRGLLHSLVGTIFIYQDLPREAITELYLANHDAVRISDTIDIIFNYRDIAEQYKYLNKNDSSIYFYKLALKYANDYGEINRITELNSQIARYFKDLGQYQIARKYMQPAIDNLDSVNISSTYSILSDIYKNTNKFDSAFIYYNKLLQYGSIYGKINAYKGLCELRLRKGDVESAFDYFRQYKHLDDSIQKRDKAETVAHMHAAYNYQKHKQKAADLELANTKKLNTINIISLSFIMAIIAAFFFFRSLVHRQKIADQRLMELNAKLEEQSTIGNDEELKVKVAKYEKEIAALSHQLQETDNDRLSIRTELESLISKLSDEKIALEHAFRRASNRQKNQEEAVFSFSETSIYIFFAQSAKEKKVVPAEKWAEFIASAETNYFRDFKNNLTNLCRISEHEYRMCLLFKSGFSKADIAKLLLIDRSAVGHAFARMYARSTKHKGTVSDWEKILQVL